MEVLKNKKERQEDAELKFDSKLDDISIKGSALLGNSIEHVELFSKDSESHKDFSIIKIKLIRATLKEPSKFKELLEHTISNDEKSVIIDMNNCEFVDSSFLSVMVGGLKRIGRMGRQLYIVHDTARKLPIFSATGLDKIFKVFNKVEDAVNP